VNLVLFWGFLALDDLMSTSRSRQGSGRETRSSAPDRMNVSIPPRRGYLGNPFSVFLVIEGMGRFHPNPKIRCPPPSRRRIESGAEASVQAGEDGKAKRAGSGDGVVVNFSPIPCMAPPPLGKETEGGVALRRRSLSAPSSPADGLPRRSRGQPLRGGFRPICAVHEVSFLKNAASTLLATPATPHLHEKRHDWRLSRIEFARGQSHVLRMIITYDLPLFEAY
jgi:hypothetical protein